MGIEKASMGCFDGYASYVVSVLTFYLLTQDVAMKLEMLHQQYDNATALARTLEANLTGKETHMLKYSYSVAKQQICVGHFCVLTFSYLGPSSKALYIVLCFLLLMVPFTGCLWQPIELYEKYQNFGHTDWAQSPE